ncbi:MAG: AraC family transcriptional regulator [Verrucomicrobia bacterium]|nr:AraC family transcriptional regulator [Verrucomicrobiota bacterium]
MAASEMNPEKIPDPSWLTDLREVCHPLGESRPIWVRHGMARTGPQPPHPTVPHPERHPYCEFNLLLAGPTIQFVRGEQRKRQSGDLMLLGPGVPHYAMLLRYPYEFITVHFLPSLLFAMGPQGDGPIILRRFTARQSLRERLARPPPALRRQMNESFARMIAEFNRPQFGSESKLRAVLADALVELLRWERRSGRVIRGEENVVHWRPVERALHYLQEHYAETVYGRQVAAAAGVSESRLEVVFREAMGIPWVRFLQNYRIHRAAALLSEPGGNVTETALAVGFENLGHFITTFRAFKGVSPLEYRKSVTRQRKNEIN